ncbi:hypothetical protein [Williamsia sp.]|uniref:hypothetical protein n=1 Tax=Williamsia sp. TaxID=1872085 RepID=UPI001A2F0A71|nr:hypothetical protein [Williamsia sp.]MBJ7290832.1 hypothetical protein [Williamsia sp.]
MADEDPTVLRSLGIDVADEYSIPDSVWAGALDAAFDPDAPIADPALVPEMDDDGDIPVDSVDDSAEISHHGGDDHAPDHVAADESHDDASIDVHGHDDIGDHPSPGHEHHDDHTTDHDWHG